MYSKESAETVGSRNRHEPRSAGKGTALAMATPQRAPSLSFSPFLRGLSQKTIID